MAATSVPCGTSTRAAAARLVTNSNAAPEAPMRPQLGPVAPLMLDAGHRERVEPLPPQLDDHAVGMRLRLGDDPGERQCDDSVTDVSPGEPALRAVVTQL